MFNDKSRKLVLTFFCSLALMLVLTDGVSANLDSHRMLRKRAPVLVGRQNRGDFIDPGTKADDNPKQDPNNSVSSSTSSQPSSPSPISSPSPSTGTSLDSSLSSPTPSSSSSSPSQPPSSTSTTSTPPSPTPPPSTPTPQNDPPVSSPTTSTPDQRTEVRTVTSSDSSSTGTSPPATGATSTTKTTLTIVIALAASIGGIAIIWTLIRKWKFKPSDKFEDRMQPIDWQPTGPEETVPGLHRATSTHSHASFYSGGHESDRSSSQQHGNSIHRGVTPLPEHDFTPGPAHLAAVGGYADLARGPSPQPQLQSQMSQMQDAQYGVPLHHQGAYDAFGTANGQRY